MNDGSVADSLVACYLQHEMTLVNKADSDRDTIDEYMEELDALHQKQLAMIQTVEEVSCPRTIELKH